MVGAEHLSTRQRCRFRIVTLGSLALLDTFGKPMVWGDIVRH